MDELQFPLTGTAPLRQVQAGGVGALATADLARMLAERAAFLARLRGRIASMWAINENPNGYTSASLRPEVVADLLLPPTAHLGEPTLALKVAWCTGGSVKVYTQLLAVLDGYQPVELTTRALLDEFNADGWYSRPLDQLAAHNLSTLTILRVSISGVSGFSGAIESLCVSCATDSSSVSDGTTAPATIKKTSILHAGGTNRPYDVVTLSRVRDAQNTIAQRYTRVLATHSLVANSGTASFRASYRVYRGVVDGECALAVRCKQDNGGGAGVAGTLTIEVNTAPIAFAAIPADNTEAWRTITIAAGNIPTGAEVQFDVRAVPAAGSTVTVYDVLLFERPFTVQDFVVFDAVTNRVETPAVRAFYGAGYDGGPIVGDYAQTDSQDLWVDRASLLRSTYHLAARCSATLIADRLGQSPGTAGGGKAGTQTLATTLLQTSPGMASAEIWVMVRRTDQINPLNRPQVFATLDGVGQETAILELGSVLDQSTTDRVWRRLGSVPLIEGATHEIKIRADFSSALDELALEGVTIFERPSLADLGQQYFYERADYSPGVAIPDNDPAGVSRSITVPASRAFAVRLMRVYVAVTHARPEDLEYSLSDGTTTVNFRYPTTPGYTTAWWSHGGSSGVIGDAPCEEDFYPFEGETSAKTWTLTVRDTAAGSTGTLDAFAIEIW